MGNPAYGKGWHERGAFETPRTQAKVNAAFEAGQKSGGVRQVIGSVAGALILVVGQAAYDQWKTRRAAARVAGKTGDADPAT